MKEVETLLIIMVVVWLAGVIFRMISLPVIFGELLGGIILGPLVLNWVNLENDIITILAELGVFFLMLHSGLETDPYKLFKVSKKSIIVSLGSIFVPFAGGFFLAQVYNFSFNESLFLGTSLSITAIALLVRLFKDYKIQSTEIANISLGAAFIGDIVGLILFSIVLNIDKEGTFDFGNITLMVIKIIVFFSAVIIAGHKTSKYLPKILRKKGFTFTLITALTLGFIAEAIGLHAIIGAFLAGLFIRQEIIEEKVFNKIEDRIYGLSYSFLGPIFFVSLGFYLDKESLIVSPIFLISIITIAILGKIIGSAGAALLQKIEIKQAFLIGIAMNNRGAVELIIASIAVKEGIINNEVFSSLIIMTFVTTILSILLFKPFARYAIDNQSVCALHK